LLRITETEAHGVVTLKLEGKLVGAWVAEAEAIVAAKAVAGPVRLNATELQFADTVGMCLLRSWLLQGIEISSSNPYSRALIELARTGC